MLFLVLSRSTGGLHKTIFLAGSFCRQTLSPAARHYICFELQHQHDRGREDGWWEQGCVPSVRRDDARDESVSGAAEAGDAGPGHHGRPIKRTSSVIC